MVNQGLLSQSKIPGRGNVTGVAEKGLQLFHILLIKSFN